MATSSHSTLQSRVIRPVPGGALSADEPFGSNGGAQPARPDVLVGLALPARRTTRDTRHATRDTRDSASPRTHRPGDSYGMCDQARFAQSCRTRIADALVLSQLACALG